MMVNLVDDERRFTRLDACNFFSKEDACKFAEKYYKTFIDSPGDIHTYYKDGSKIIRPGDVFFRKYTREEIKEKLLRHKYSEVKLDNEEIYVDYYSPGVEMVYVSGRLIEEDSTIERFTQTFLIEQHKTKEGKYFVVCDKFNTLGKDGVSESDVDDNEDGYSVDNSDIDTDEEQVFTTRTQAELGDPRDGSVIDEEPELPNFAGDGKSAASTLMSSKSKYEKFDQYQQSSKKKGSPKRVRDEADSGNESQNRPEKELLHAGEGKKLASTFIPSKRESENVFGRNKSKVKKEKFNGSPRRPRDEDESEDKIQNMPTKALLHAGGGKESSSTSILLKRESEKGNVFGRNTSKVKKEKFNGSPRRPRNEDESEEKNQNLPTKKCESETGNGSVIDAEPELALFKGTPKRPRDEGESRKESQNVLGKQSLQAGDGITSASDLISSKREAEKGNGSAQNKSKSKKKHSKGSPRKPGNVDESRNKSQKMLTKLLEAGDGKKLGSTSSSSGIEDEWPKAGSEKRKIKKADQVDFSPEKPQIKCGSGNQSRNMLPEDRTLDLHGQTNCEEAKLLTINFLQKFSLRPSDVIVTVIPGRGKNSKDKIPILQPMVLELLEDLKLNNYIRVYNKGGAVDITIKQGWSFSLSGYKNQESALISNVVDSSYKSKDASSSNAQVSSWAGEYMIKANDNDGYVDIIEEFARRIRCRGMDVISLPMDRNIFQQGNVNVFYVLRNDLTAFCNMDTVDVTLISAYMRFLFAKYEKSCKIITFLDPAFTSKYLSLGISEGLKREKRNQLLFIPYNIQSMAHWVLMVIVCSTMTVYWVDSLHTKPDAMIEVHVKTGLNPLFTSNTERPIWEIIKGPKQPPDSVQCGYFVMKFMRDLIFTDEPSQSQSIEMKMEKLAGKVTYTLEEINLVRAEFSNYITVLEKISSAPAVLTPDE